MKNIIVLLVLLLQVSLSFGQDRKLTLSINNKPISSLFREIEAKSGYTFIYSDEIVTDSMLISVSMNRAPVSEILDQVLPAQELFYELLSEKMIVINKIPPLTEGNHTKTLLSGIVLNPDGKPVPFATIGLLENDIKVNGAIAAEEGNFRFYHQFNPGKKYSIKISSIGYEVLTMDIPSLANHVLFKSFGNLILKPDAKLLKEVTVSSAPKVYELDGGNIVFNVAASISAQGLNALEVLGRAPGVTVGTDNNISLNGKSGAAVLIDGKPTYLSGREVAELLRTMSSTDIKTIEIINSPSAKYDAAGTAGIINVTTSKSQVQGFRAAITTGLSYGVYVRSNQDLSLSYRNDRLTLFGNYSHFIGNYSYLYGANRIQSGKFYNSFTDDIDKRNKMNSRLGADFAIDKKQTVGILLNGNFIFGGGITDTRTEIGIVPSANAEEVLTAINDYYAQQTQRYNVNLNYTYEDTLGKILNFDVDYGDYTKRAGNLQTNKYTASDNTVLSDNLYRSLNAIDINLGAVQLDYTSKLGQGNLETGLKYSTVSTANDSRFLEVLGNIENLDPTRSNHFDYSEKIAGAYVNYKKQFGKWQLVGGLRVENSNSKGVLEQISPIAGNEKATGRNYTNLFPFFSANLKASPSNSYSLSYSRRIDRPAYQNLNPFIYLLDELSFWQGNPFLKPQLSHRLVMQYVYKSSTIASLNYTYTNDFSVEVTDTIDQTKIVMVPRNLGVQQHLALTLTQTLNLYDWWNIAFNGTLFGLYNNIDFGSGRALKLRQTAGRLSLQQTFKLPHAINAEVMGYYNSKRLVGANQFRNPTSQIDLGLQRSFMDNKASLRLVYNDIYKGTRANSVQRVPGLYVENHSYFESRQVRLNFSYRFASGNSKGPRTRSSALENENGRIK